MDPLIDAAEVERILFTCLFRDAELIDRQPPADAVIVEGIINKFGFHPGRLEFHKIRIKELLYCLPPEFQKSKGGGWSFLNACLDSNGTQWGEHANMDQLFVLGMATRQAVMLTPRGMWDVFPGGMPYFMVL